MNHFKINSKSDFEMFACCQWNAINDFLNKLSQDLPVPIYSSIDIRESRDKFAPVDYNLYPAGFNNLCSMDLKKSTQHFINYILDINLDAKNIGIIPESNTKNLFYLDHLYALRESIAHGDYNVYFVSFDEELFPAGQVTLELTSQSGHPIVFQKGKVLDQKLVVMMEKGETVVLDLAIMNHDQSTPLPLDWQSITTPVQPPPQLGWYNREKAKHFTYYEQVVRRFSDEFKINPDVMMAKFKCIYDVDFASMKGLDRLAQAVDELKVGLNNDTKVFVKPNKGTYGMGISVVGSGEELLHINRKTRNKMDIGKSGIKFTSILLQEGVETILKYDGHPAEVTIYLINGKSAGGFMRTNPLRDAVSNLNARGMVFQKFCISEIAQDKEHKCKEAAYSIIARLSTIAASYEIKEALGK